GRVGVDDRCPLVKPVRREIVRRLVDVDPRVGYKSDQVLDVSSGLERAAPDGRAAVNAGDGDAAPGLVAALVGGDVTGVVGRWFKECDRLAQTQIAASVEAVDAVSIG